MHTHTEVVEPTSDSAVRASSRWANPADFRHTTAFIGYFIARQSHTINFLLSCDFVDQKILK